MEDADPHADVIRMIYQYFDVSHIAKTEFSIEFKIAEEGQAAHQAGRGDVGPSFEQLARKLEHTGYVARLLEIQGARYVIVQKFQRKKSRRILDSSWTPRLLFGVVVAFVMIDGFYRTSGTNTVIEIGDPLETAVVYTLALLGILGVHEAGHIAAARLHGLKTTWPYFIPGLPIIGIPTFGAFIQSRGLTINRVILFDVAIAGPVAGLVIAVIVSMYGAYTAPIIDSDVAASLFEDSVLSEWNQGEPLFMTLSLAAFGKGGDGHEVIMTPVMFAAWIGFLITFLNMLPAWQLDGGHMARTMMSHNIHRYATYASMMILVLLGYWVMAVLILVLSMRNPSASPLDEVTPLPASRKAAYAGIVVLAVLCAPIPSSLPFLP